MTDLPGWSCTGVAPIADLSVLESALHAGRVSAAELGYVQEPQIGIHEVMLTNPTAPVDEAQLRHRSKRPSRPGWTSYRPTSVT